ncbi:tRNA G10 N-methylase Trm11 [Cohnella sp. SGD-V74]|uniref:TRM11 family SAM-dependent methyltransferase n=1 Tax=unclassified Cohnella TaxID=2636738 RepID=UPI000D4D94BD|nr:MULTISPECIES: RNA methyltransferase [unclassified Cohnella]PRX72186.1 tRNA G10 N-methylase Trm11 [Cohnella sp. SGD-V74]
MADYLYAIASTEEERGLCLLEMRCLLGADCRNNLIGSREEVEPGRSPFIKNRIRVLCESDELAELAELAGARVELDGRTFKVSAIDNDDPEEQGRFDYALKRELEREVGFRIRGRADMRSPEREFGFARFGGRWVFGELRRGNTDWMKHRDQPRQYSTALSNRVARSVVNIAVPRTAGVRAIDPCCGIGTVLLEAMSLGVDIVGRDVNPLAALGARENLAYYGYGSPSSVTLGDMREIEERFDVAIIDMPYNLCSVLSDSEKAEMMRSARRFASRAVVVTIEEMDSFVREAGFEIRDRCAVNKGNRFSRQVLVCE